MALIDLLLGGPAGATGATGESVLDRLLARQQQAPNPTFGTPPFVPEQSQAPAQPTPKQVAAVQTAKDPSLANILLGKLGKPGRALMPVSKFLGEVGGALEDQARRGRLGSLAPTFSAGVQNADRADLNRRFIEAQIQRMTAPQAQETPKASTDRGKVEQDFRAGIITQEQRDSRMAEIDAVERRAQSSDAATLRGERDKIIGASTEALQSLRAADTLLNADNPFADVASLTSFIRSIDNSVVRPSEQANFDAALGLVNQIESIYQRARGDGVLTPAARKSLKESIAALRENYEAILDGQEQFFKDEAKAAGIDPTRVLRGTKPPPVKARVLEELTDEQLEQIANGSE